MAALDEQGDETELYHRPELRWPRHYRRFLKVLIYHGGLPSTREHDQELDRQALPLTDAMIKAVNQKLPDHCSWPAGGDTVYGPPDTPLPDITELVNDALAEAVQNAGLIYEVACDRCDEVFDSPSDSFSDVEARSTARRAGWCLRDGGDYSPTCAAYAPPPPTSPAQSSSHRPDRIR